MEARHEAELGTALLGGSFASRSRKSVTLDEATLSGLSGDGPQQKIKRNWTCASPSEKQFRGVQVSAKDFTMEATARIFTRSNVEMESRMVGRAMKRMARVLSDVPPEAELQGEGDAGDEEFSAGLQTNGEAKLNMLNQSLACSMLGMGYAIQQAGLLMGFIMMVCSLLLNRKTLFLCLKNAAYAGVAPASTEVGSAAFGKGGQLLLVAMVFLLGYLMLVCYVSACADAVRGLLALAVEEDQIPSKTNLAIICWACLLMPTTWIRSMNKVAMLSFIAFLGSIGIVLSVSAVCITILAHQGLPPMASINMFPKDFTSFLNALPIVVLVFSCQAGGDVILATMKDDSEANQERVVVFAQRIAFFMLYVAGALSYATFGDATAGDLLLNLPAAGWASVLARVASLDCVVLSYMIMSIPCRVAFIDAVFGKNEARQESSALEYYGAVSAINVCALAVALRITDVSLVMGMCGAVCINFVALVLPPAFWIKLRSEPADPTLEAVPLLSAANVPYYLIFAGGVASVLLSTYQVVQRMQQGQ